MSPRFFLGSSPLLVNRNALHEALAFAAQYACVADLRKPSSVR